MEIFAVSMQDINNELNGISIKDIKYQLNKTAKALTDPKTVIFKEYYKFLNVFLKKVSDMLSPHSKYNHQIRLLEKYRDYGYSLLSKIFEPKLQFVKKFLEEHLKKGFIKASSALCSSRIMLAAKLGGGIRFCVDYRCLNKLTKKDAYPIPPIEETLAQLKNTRSLQKSISVRHSTNSGWPLIWKITPHLPCGLVLLSEKYCHLDSWVDQSRGSALSTTCYGNTSTSSARPI